MATRYSGQKRQLAALAMPAAKRRRYGNRRQPTAIHLFSRRSSCSTAPKQSIQFSFEETSIDDDGVIVQLNCLESGLTTSRRRTSKVHWTRLVMKGHYTLSKEAEVIARYHQAYNFLVWDKTPGDETPRVSDIFTEGSEPDLSEKNPLNKKRFSVLWEKHTMLIGAGAQAVFPSRKSVGINWSKKMNHTSEYKDFTNGNIAAMHSGALYLIIASFYPETITFTGRSRLYFRSI